MSLPSYKSQQIAYQDQILPRYNLQASTWSPLQRFYAEREYVFAHRMLRQLGLAEHVSSLLVCGVGAGTDLEYWITRLPITTAVGLDFSTESLKASLRRVALHQLPDVTRFIQADFEDVPLADNSVDLGIFVHTLHHAWNPECGFKELWRVARKGVVVIEPLDTVVTRLFARLGLAQEVEPSGNRVLRFNHRQFRHWAAAELESYRYLNCFYPYHPLIYRRIIPLLEMLRAEHAFKIAYYIANALLIPLHSKTVILLKKA